MILASRGCHNKCAFCFTSWTTFYQYNPFLPELDRNVLLITNDNQTDAELNAKAYVRSITVKKYLSLNRFQANNCKNYRFGIESWNEETRKKIFKKPIKTEDIVRATRIAKHLKHNMKYFIICGIDPVESVLEFLEPHGIDLALRPILEIKGTYFEPSPHTPLKNFDVRHLITWDKDRFYGYLNEYFPKRVRLTIRADQSHGVWRAFFHRARNIEEIQTIWKMKKKSYGELFELAIKNNWRHLFDQTPPTNIKFWWEKKSVTI